MRSPAPSRSRTAWTSSRETPGRIATPSRTSSRTRSGDFQLWKSASSSAPRMKTASVGRRCFECVDGACVEVELDGQPPGRPRTPAARARAARRPRSWRSCGPGLRRRGRGAPRARALGSPREREPGGRDAEDRRLRRGCLLPLERLLSDLDLRAALDAELAQRLLQLVGWRWGADHAIPTVRAQDAEAWTSPGTRRVLEELRHGLVHGRGVDRDRARTGRTSTRRYRHRCAGCRDDAYDALVGRFERRNGVEEVDLVQDDELRLDLEPGSVRGELVGRSCGTSLRDPARRRRARGRAVARARGARGTDGRDPRRRQRLR